MTTKFNMPDLAAPHVKQYQYYSAAAKQFGPRARSRTRQANAPRRCKRASFEGGRCPLVPSRPGEFHPEPLAGPDGTLSHHPARATE